MIMEIALYRKHRPHDFDDVSGQDHVIKTLKSAIKKKELHHAYIFSGTRGTGKTSVARIFARAIGCNEMDIHEIDAASQNSVENIRDLNDSVRTIPLKSVYKVYILDEAHMLSKSAFNAFLKTLEEPPSHTVFILATTEPSKLPDTVISRCQNFTFKKPSLELLEKTVMSVAKKEGYEIDSESASVIALLSGGAFRDALGILQKALIASDGKKVSRDVIEKVLGAPTSDQVNIYLEAFAECDIKKGVDAIEKLAEDNIDMRLLVKLALRKLRSIILFRFTDNKSLLDDYNKKDSEFIKKEAKNDKLNLDVLSLLLRVVSDIPKSYIPHLPLEIALIEHKERQQQK
ncbi:MAG: DNA polymerase III subunit gamma/tau [Candidatus Campbellbacteria bacterium]|nr:DNA polymerase III subunit gamma/tau [Candidatus Campbellbacteria bacterium]